jgi:hypothetical protein
MEASQPGAPEQDERTDEQREADAQAEQERQEAEDSAIRGEQGEQVASDAPGGLDQSTPVATSAPSPDSQGGVPLAEDREAGVEPGPVHPGDERPEGSDQTAASPAEPAE